MTARIHGPGSRPRRGRRVLRAAAGLSLSLGLALGAAACSGLPTSGPPQAGLPLGESSAGVEITLIPDGPGLGAGPQEIVEGFLEAAISPTDSWAIARQFLSPSLAGTWRAGGGVTIDDSSVQRVVDSSVGGDTTATTAEVKVTLSPVASVDEQGAYRVETGDSGEAAFRLERNAEGEWRITAAPDGIILDEASFREAFRRYDLQYFDHTWTRLVPDVRWFPRRGAIPTAITQTLLQGSPAPWLAPAVRTAFPAGIVLARDAVPVDAAQVAEVELNEAALELDPTTLARMRTQLERSLAATGVTAVRFTADGRPLEAGQVPVESNLLDGGTIVLTADAFGVLVGDRIQPLNGVSAPIEENAGNIVAIDLARDSSLAAVLTVDAVVRLVHDGGADTVDDRAGLVPPSIDPGNAVWSVPQSEPQAVRVRLPDSDVVEVANAWPDASAISHLRVSPDGSRVAALVTVGTQRWTVVSAIVRGEDSRTIELGPMERVGRLPGAGGGLVWFGDDVLGVLALDGDRTVLLQQIVGGPAGELSVPEDTVSIAGASSVSGVRVLGPSGTVFVSRGSTWQEEFAGALVLATRAGQ